MAKVKIFGIGFHKTGTKSLEKALTILGYDVCGPSHFRRLFETSRWKDFTEVYKFIPSIMPIAFTLAKKHDACQDNPWTILYKELDEKFPGSKFILTVRPVDSWIKSVVNYFGTQDTLLRKWIYGIGHPAGHEDLYILRYNLHILQVKEYFKNRPHDLLILNICEGEGWEKLCLFLMREIPAIDFPHFNVGEYTHRTRQPEKRHQLVGPENLWEMKRDFQITFLKKMGLKPDHVLLDIGCGTLRGGLPIIEYVNKGHYYGIEVRKEVLEEGKKELHEAHLEDKEPVLILFDNFSSLQLNTTFDVIWAFSVLIHMADEICFNCFNFIASHLKETGIFLANVNIGDTRELVWQGFPVIWRSLEFYRELARINNLHITDMGPLHTLGHVTNIASQDHQRMLKFTKINQ